MRSPRMMFRSWRDSVSTAIAVTKSRREFEKVLENRPYNIVQCAAAHRLAERLTFGVAGTLTPSEPGPSLPEITPRPQGVHRIYPWTKFELNAEGKIFMSYDPHDPIDDVDREAVKEHIRIGDTFHLISMGNDQYPPLFVWVYRTADGTGIDIGFGLMRHRNAAAYVNCMECHNYASEWLSKMVIPGASPDERPRKVGPVTRLVVWGALLLLAIRAIGLTSDLVDVYSHLETAIEWIDLTAGT